MANMPEEWKAKMAEYNAMTDEEKAAKKAQWKSDYEAMTPE